MNSIDNSIGNSISTITSQQSTANMSTINQQASEIYIELFGDKHVRVYGTFERPLFVAADIGKLVGHSNIRKVIQDYDFDEVLLGVTIGYMNENEVKRTVSMLTESGLYRFLYTSR